MCGRFAQSQTREDYLAYLAEEAERDIPYDPEPIGRYNVAPGTKVLLLSERDEQLHLDAVHWVTLQDGGTVSTPVLVPHTF
jgi:putative SOS response-associated peptidase YedK